MKKKEYGKMFFLLQNMYTKWALGGGGLFLFPLQIMGTDLDHAEEGGPWE